MNSTIQTSAEECLKAQEIAQNNLILVGMIGQILMSCLVLLQLRRCVMLVSEKHIQLHANLRLLMTSALIGYIYTCFTSLAFPIFYLWRRSRRGPPCDYMYEKTYCYCLRWPVYYGIVFQSFLHLAISLERALATKYMHTYAQGFLWWGRGIALGVFVSAILMASSILKTDDTVGYFAYCNITTPSTAARIRLGLAIMLAIDCLAVITDIILYAINYRIKRNRKRMSPKIYTLTWSYQLTENNCSTTIVIPVTASQSVCYLMYITSSLVVRIIMPQTGVAFSAMANFCFMFFQLSLLMATIAFHRKYLMNYNIQMDRRIVMKGKQSSQQHFTLLERQLDEAYKKRSVVAVKNNSETKKVAYTYGRRTCKAT